MSREAIAREKLEKIVAEGRFKATQGLELLATEYGMRKDFIVKPDAIGFAESPSLTPVVAEHPYSLTPHSRRQLLARAGIPNQFADGLEELKRPDLLRHNLIELLPTVSKEGVMFRAVGDTAKGILSPAYRRMDASPIYEGYVQQSMAAGLVPYRGTVTDTRASLSFIQPRVIELVPGEYVVMGTQLLTSDYGNGALEFNLSILRLLCVNGMVGMDLMRKVHLGKRFHGRGYDETGVIELSRRTMELDTRTVRSALGDAVRGMDRHMKALEENARGWAGEDVSIHGVLEKLKKGGMRKELVEKVKTMYEAELPVEALPEAPGKWRLANVIALLANGEQGDAHIDLQKKAMEVLIGGRAA